MASLRKANGRWVLQFTTPDKRRRTVRLGAIQKRDAESVKTHVETIISSAFAGMAMPDDTARWLSVADDPNDGASTDCTGAPLPELAAEPCTVWKNALPGTTFIG